MIGRVISTKMNRTVVVLVESHKTHPLYRKTYLRTKNYLVDDPFGVKLGDLVDFKQVRPISKRKNWQITKVVGKDEVALGTEAMKEAAGEAIAEVMPEEEVEIESRVESQESGEKEQVVKEKVKKVTKTKKEEN